MAAGAGVLVISSWEHRARAKEELNASSLDVAEPMLKVVLEAARHCIPTKKSQLPDIDEEKLAAACSALRQQKGVKPGGDVQLSADEFRLIMNMLSTKNDEMLAALFAALDTRGCGSVSLKRCEAAVLVLAGAQVAPPDVSKTFVFDLFDVAGKGRITQAELEAGVTRLIHVALAHTQGKFLQYVHLNLADQPDVSIKDVATCLITVATRDIHGVHKAKDISKAEFDTWLASDGRSSTTVRLLLQTMGTALAGPVGWDTGRYGGYLFLFKRFTVLAAKKVRFLAFTSDVGEAVRPVVPNWVVNATYGVAIAYCVGDVAYVGYKESKKGEAGHVARAVAFQTVFQGLASIALPYLIIHTAVHQVSFVRLFCTVLGLFCTVLGLFCTLEDQDVA